MIKWAMVYVMMLVLATNVVASVIAPFPINYIMMLMIPFSCVVFVIWLGDKP